MVCWAEHREVGKGAAIGVELEIVAMGGSGEDAVDAVGGKQLFRDDAVQQGVAVGEELSRFPALVGMIEDAGVDALEAPGVEERGPVDVGAELGEGEILENADAGEGGLGNVFRAPLNGGAALTGLGRWGTTLSLGAACCLRSDSYSSACWRMNSGLFSLAEQAGGDRDGAACVQHVNNRVRVVRCDFDRGVGAAGGGAADDERLREALALHLAGDVDHFVERRRNEPAEADDVDVFPAWRGRGFSRTETITPMSMTS